MIKSDKKLELRLRAVMYLMEEKVWKANMLIITSPNITDSFIHKLCDWSLVCPLFAFCVTQTFPAAVERCEF